MLLHRWPGVVAETPIRRVDCIHRCTTPRSSRACATRFDVTTESLAESFPAQSSRRACLVCRQANSCQREHRRVVNTVTPQDPPRFSQSSPSRAAPHWSRPPIDYLDVLHPWRRLSGWKLRPGKKKGILCAKDSLVCGYSNQGTTKTYDFCQSLLVSLLSVR